MTASSFLATLLRKAMVPKVVRGEEKGVLPGAISNIMFNIDMDH